MDDEWHKLEADCRVLEGVAKCYPSESLEYKAIERAADAMLFILSSKIEKEYFSYLRRRQRASMSSSRGGHMLVAHWKKSLLERIRGAFGTKTCPGCDRLVEGDSSEAEQIAESLIGRRWQDLDIEFLCSEHVVRFSLMTQEAFCYFLPAFMSASISDYATAESLARNLVRALTVPPAEELAGSAYADDREKFLDTMRGLNKEQGRAVCEFLEYLDIVHGDDYPDNDPRVAVDSFWLDFARDRQD